MQKLPENELRLIERDWRGWGHEAQMPPDGDWATWLFLGGRGAGKTRAGAEWLTDQAVPGARLALIGPTLHDVREVMIEGPSGLRAIAPKYRRPAYEPARRRLVWPNGAEAFAFSAAEPERLRGPQFHAAWADEFCAWKRPGDVLPMLRMGLRLGDDPRLAITTTPRPIAALKALAEEPTTKTTHAPTRANARNLASGFLRGLGELYGGTRLAAQELEGLILEEGEALWTRDMLDRCRGRAPERFDLVVVGLDPPATAGGDACGVVVVGRAHGVAYVLADESVAGMSPAKWAAHVADVVARHEADRVVAEVNQGGDMVVEMLKLAKCGAVVKPVFAKTSKRARAEPVAMLYDQNRVIHTRAFGPLEEELEGLGLGLGRRSPDRADALVWAVSHLLLNTTRSPSVRVL
ncbi:DNA-packaging protein [Brevundimonas lenta]|uniref:Phage terminase large subunit-like protein n=1 Tax=Brevundimonas lenta TaxID=424796 RepID=A0A7W6NPY4_9CAUL|nr:terminase family protein [Brevundimonas lenta]MBB4083895.1 phage terminase large subunit-like protein [Brevundimonas lenta]